MNKRIITFLLAAILSLTLIFSGCGNSLNTLKESVENNVASNSRAATEKSSGSSSKKSEEKTEANDKAYTMSDIYKLKNTERFGKNTLEHIFDGTINSKGKATGYHYSKVTDSKGSIIDGTKSTADKNGIFTAKVKVNNVKKNGFSSFYPESWSPQQVVDAINEAYDYAVNDKNNPHGSLWIGYSGDLEIDMYLDNNKKITTAYPVREGE